MATGRESREEDGKGLAAHALIEEKPAVPKFAANLSFIFQEVGFLGRFAAAAGCGFKRSSISLLTSTRPTGLRSS